MMASYTGQTERNTLRAGTTFFRDVLVSSALGLGLIIAPGMAAESLVAEHRAVTASVDRTIGTDGVYLYGEVSKPNQPGKGYVIFSKAGSQVIGAIYYPQSEFSCFVGKQADTKLNVNLVESGRASEGVEVRLKPMYAIHTIGSAEASALAVCRQEAAPVRQRAEQTARTPAAFSLPRT